MIDDFSPKKEGRPTATALVQPTAAPRDFGETPTLDTAALDIEQDNQKSTAPGKKHRFHLTKKQWIIVGIVAGVLVLAASGYWAWKASHPKNKTNVGSVQNAPAKPAPTVYYSNLTGLPVDPSVNQRPVTAVMIENSLDARPQSGLNEAGVVFEAVAEGGITRFLALFQDTQPSYIGPVRSVRPYYLQWLQGFDASVAHVGGSPEALSDIKSWGIKDLDQFANGSYYTRISSRYAPHNVYTSMANLNAIEAKKGYGASKYTSFPRKSDAPAKQPNVTSIDFGISSVDYNSHFDYNSVNNTYTRSEGGAPHLQIDQAGTKYQITPKVVLGLVMPQGIEADDLHTSYTTIGSGAMYVFQDGTVTQGTWSKTSGQAQFTFTDAKGQPIKLNRGQTWITVLGGAKDVSYK